MLVQGALYDTVTNRVAFGTTITRYEHRIPTPYPPLIICNPTLLQTRFANVHTWLVCNPALFANQELRNRCKRLRTTYRFTHRQVCVTKTQYLMRPGLTVISGLKRIIWFEERLNGQNTNTTAVQARHGSYRTGV